MPPSRLGSAALTCSALAWPIRLAGSAGSRQPAGDVGQEDHLVGAERARHRAGGLVGVDVVGVPSRSAPTEAITGM